MPTPFDTYRIFQLEDFPGTLAQLLGSYFELDAPDLTIASGHKSHRLRGDALQTLMGANRGPNAAPSSAFHQVRFARTSSANYVAGDWQTLDDLEATPGLLGLGHTATVIDPVQGEPREYVVMYAAGGFPCWRDGSNQSTSSGEWVAVDSPRAQAQPYAYYGPTYAFAPDDLVRAVPSDSVNGSEVFFSAKGSGLLPAPTLAAGDANWARVDETQLPTPTRPAWQDIVGDPQDADALGPHIASLIAALAKGARAWQNGAALMAGMLTYNSAKDLFLVLQDIANPATEPTYPLSGGLAPYYRFIGPPRLYSATGTNTDGALTQKAATDAFAPKNDLAAVAAFAAPVTAYTGAGAVVSYTTLDAMVADGTAKTFARVNRGELSVATGNGALSRTGFPYYFDGSGSTIYLSDGVSLRAEGDTAAALFIANCFFVKATGSTGTGALSVGTGTGSPAAPLPGVLFTPPTLLNVFVRTTLTLTGGEVHMIGGSAKNVTGTGTLYLYGNAQVDTVAAGVTVVGLRPNDRYNVPAALINSVVAGTFSTTGSTTGELTSAVPAGSQRGMRFKKGQATYEFMPNDAGTADTWVRTPAG